MMYIVRTLEEMILLSLLTLFYQNYVFRFSTFLDNFFKIVT